VAEKDNGRISVFSTDGKFIYGFGCQNNPHHFNQPRGIAFDNEGHLYICDHGNNRIVVY
jgi:DNA-binding beta-propeller fold protein YncE